MLHPAARHERAQRPDRLVRRCPAGRGSPWRAVTEWTRASVPPHTAATRFAPQHPRRGRAATRRPSTALELDATRRPRPPRSRRDTREPKASAAGKGKGYGGSAYANRIAPPVLLEQRQRRPSTRSSTRSSTQATRRGAGDPACALIGDVPAGCWIAKRPNCRPAQGRRTEPHRKRPFLGQPSWNSSPCLKTRKTLYQNPTVRRHEAVRGFWHDRAYAVPVGAGRCARTLRRRRYLTLQRGSVRCRVPRWARERQHEPIR